MEFLVRIDVHIPPDMPADERAPAAPARVRPREGADRRGHAGPHLADPGRQSNWSLYNAEDANAVHAAVTSLPLWPYMDVRVEPLATHPLEGGLR